MARAGAIIEARRVLIMGSRRLRFSAALKDAVRRMSPCRRAILVWCPRDPHLAEHQPDEYDVIERALRANVLVNVLNPGVFTLRHWTPPTSMDTRTERPSKPPTPERGAARGSVDRIRGGHGGYYFHNNNDLAEASAGSRRPRKSIIC